MRTIVIGRDHPLRRKAEFTIRQTYFEKYGAVPGPLPAMLVGVLTPGGTIPCLAGLRTAGEGFFSQHYLDEPITEVAARLAGVPVPAESIVEVTGLVSRSPLCTGRFVLELVRLGARHGFEWALFTATERLGRLLRRRGLPLLPLVKARRDRVPDPERWGTYYEDDPTVFLLRRDALEPFLHPEMEAGADV